jgi:hypothetical protein
LLTLATLSAFRLPVFPVIDTNPGSAGLLQAKQPDCNVIGRIKS